ncbi:hypothetical protein K437DRAFT_273559 [Tilletiaria anomala UBC 951]|uniref:Ras GTPase-activating-like protein IQGAP2 n=1 Tax=Tilletiaria anomala (strain ATCC 24038 / CBS 436.72 / UBC 951) TaxID=1037660 RepID=A0A066WB27_TILAU|nr:uncharacterized protein K437DRAFT_273559 [Tilletiaria anomala UBC 951]KDN47975.1 hypothetical protein K437DRAFT_273559 [Tilletiaria anomala UBC 951]
MDAKSPPSAPSSGAAATGSVRNSPFAYQTRMLERSCSRSSVNSFSLADPASSSPGTATAAAPVPGGVHHFTHGSMNSLNGATGLHHAGSIRRYHGGAGRSTGSLDLRGAGSLMNSLSIKDGSAPATQGFGSVSPSRVSPSEFSTSTGASSSAAPSSIYSSSSSGGAVFPNGNGMFGSSYTTYTTASSVSPTLAGSSSYKPSGLAGSVASRSSRPFSMPPAPRNGSVDSSQISPTKFSAAYSPVDPRSASPTKMYTGSSIAGFDSPKAAGTPSREQGSPVVLSPPFGSGSFWAQSGGGGGASAAPAQLHLGVVKDLKRSSVPTLKMMREFTTRSCYSAASGEDGGLSGPRMVVGSKHTNPGALKEEEEGRPERPGRMQSEDQGEGEIVLPGITTGAEDVHGLSGRIRLAKQSPAMVDSPWAPGSPRSAGVFAAGGAGAGSLGTPFSRTSAAGSLPFSATSKWMDTQRHLLQAYEYLCHCGEAKEWMEHHVGEELGAVIEMEESMRNGIFLAKLARRFEPECVPKIFTSPRLQYKHTDNVNYFFRAVTKIGLPEFFHFELTDLYEKKNFPKVVYCVHALSHILARQGRAIKVGNLIGKLEFTDDQLQQTQRGLDAAGVSMPQFGGLGKALAKEMNVEPEPEPETEQERIDRELRENVEGVVTLQTACRATLARASYRRLQQNAECRAAELERLRLEAEARRQAEEDRRRQEEEERVITSWTPAIQGQIRGALARKAWYDKRAALQTSQGDFGRLQAACRGLLARRSHAATQQKIASFDQEHGASIVNIQAQCRGVLARRQYEALIFKLSDSIEDVIKLQSALRAVLARRRLLSLVRHLRGSNDSIISVQAQVRGVLARRSHRQMSTALQKVEVTKAVGSLQSFARAALARRKHQEQRKQLDFVTPDVVGVQAQIRGVLARIEYQWWRNHLIQSEPVAIHLQSLLRGMLARRTFNAKLRHYHEHMDKVVKIQSLFRGKQQGQQYRSLTVGKNVPVSTIKNFGHLLNDSDIDFEDEIEVERLRKLVVRSIRETQTLENDVQELDTKIALLVKNKIGIEELIRVKNERGLLGPPTAANLQRRNSVLVAANDPFAEGQHLDRTARNKLELYQELFYMLQTRPEYIARLFARVGKMEMSDRNKKQVEKVVLTLFGYAQNSREEFLLLKLFQRCVSEELSMVNSVQEFIRGNAQFIKLVVQYNRGAKERKYLRDLLGPLVQGIINDEGLDLETDPCAIYRQAINLEEMETGMPSRKPLDVSFDVALLDPAARTIFIRHLQALRATTEAFLSALTSSTTKMPFGIRYIAREVFRALQNKFPQEPEAALIKVVGHLVYYRYLNPAIVAPEGFDVIEKLVGPVQRKNLAEVSKMLTQVAVGRLFSDDNPYLQPLNEYVSQASARFTQWFYAIVDVHDAEMQFAAEEFIDATTQDRPVIYISPNEIYALHLLLGQQMDTVAPNQADPLRILLNELGLPPQGASSELNSARDSEITLELVGRRTALQDPEAESKALFVETKRLVLSVLKVQSGQTLYKVLLEPVTDQDELTWEEVVSLEITADRARQRGQRPPPSANHTTPKLQDVRRLSFVDLKAHTLQNMLKLEQLGKVSRANEFQDMLNAIAIDIRNKHRKRIQRANEKAAMHVTLNNLGEKKAYLEEQIQSYNSYIDASMQTMQKKGRKKFVLPFTQQYFHLRSLKASGKVPKFGSYKYTAQRLHEKGVLLTIDGFSSKQYDQISLTISSDEAGLFTIEASVLGVVGGSCDLRIEDLLEAQFNGLQTLTLMDSMAKCNTNLLIHLINKKFYA